MVFFSFKFGAINNPLFYKEWIWANTLCRFGFARRA